MDEHANQIRIVWYNNALQTLVRWPNKDKSSMLPGTQKIGISRTGESQLMGAGPGMLRLHVDLVQVLEQIFRNCDFPLHVFFLLGLLNLQQNDQLIAAHMM